MKSDNKKMKNEIIIPLFTGDYRRDCTVTLYERFAEVTNFLWEFIKNICKN